MNYRNKNQKYIGRYYLHEYEGIKVNCIGTYIEESVKRLKHGGITLGCEVILLRNVFETSGKFWVEHCWVPMTEEIRNLQLMQGEKIQFFCTIYKYYKGRYNNLESFGLMNLSQINKTKKIVLNYC